MAACHGTVTLTKENLNAMLFVVDFHVNPLFAVEAEPAIAHIESAMRNLAKHPWNRPVRARAGNHAMLAVTHPNQEAMAKCYDALATLAPGVPL